MPNLPHPSRPPQSPPATSSPNPLPSQNLIFIIHKTRATKSTPSKPLRRVRVLETAAWTSTRSVVLSRMAPLVEAFHPARLQQHVQYHPNGKARKPPVDLKQCELKELIQYECDLRGPKAHP